ncbi:MAG: hypothetical protein IJK98_05080, partial [Clostridia bacterium]|nr:hypothetical protein [Clostridia bacterium]
IPMKPSITKRIFVLFLAVMMAFSSLPLALAEDAPEVTDQSDYNVESTNSLGNMLAATVEATAADPDESYFISDMTIEGNKATVTFQNAAACDLVIAAYDEDTMEMLCSDTARVAAGADTAELTLTNLTAKNMIVKAFLLDDSHQALCKNYTFREYSKDYKEFMSKTVDDFNEEQVINLDEAKDNNFLVLNEGAKTVYPTEEANHIIIADFEEDTFVFSDANSAITGLKEGDLFYYALEDMEELIIIRVKSVTVDEDNTATVKGERVALEDAFEYVKIDVDVEDEDFEALDENAAEISAEENQFAPRNATDLNPEHTFTKSFSLNWPKKEDDDSSGEDKDDDGKVSFKLHGTGSFSATAKFRVYLSKKYKEVSFVVTTELKLDFGAEVEIKAVEKKLGEFGIHPIPGLFIGINPTFVFTISGKLSTNVTFGFDLGGQWDSKDGFTNKCRKLEPDFDGIELEATVFVGIDLKPKARLISDKVVKAELSGTIGFELKGKMSWLKSGGRVEHLCKNCLDGSLAFKLDIKFKVVFAEGKHGWIVSEKKYELPILNLTIPICDFYWSFTYGKHGGGKCPYHLVKVDFTVKDAADGKALENAEIASGTTDDIAVKYNSDSAVVKTDKDGKASYYYPLGAFTATVTCTDYITKQTDEIKIDYLREADEFYVNDSAKQATIECKLTEDISHIQFGTYPQSRVTDAATIAKLEAASKTWASYGYYSGTGDWADGKMTPGDFMQFADFKVNGVKYRAVKISEYRPYYTGYTRTASYTHQDENGYTPGTYYFKYEPLRWRVLDASTGYVMCESLIDAQAYQNTVYHGYKSTVYYGYKYGEYYWQESSQNTLANDYDTSALHAWLNYDFYET